MELYWLSHGSRIMLLVISVVSCVSFVSVLEYMYS